jgi:hypothetical protein
MAKRTHPPTRERITLTPRSNIAHVDHALSGSLGSDSSPMNAHHPKNSLGPFQAWPVASRSRCCFRVGHATQRAGRIPLSRRSTVVVERGRKARRKPVGRTASVRGRAPEQAKRRVTEGDERRSRPRSRPTIKKREAPREPKPKPQPSRGSQTHLRAGRESELSAGAATASRRVTCCGTRPLDPRLRGPRGRSAVRWLESHRPGASGAEAPDPLRP